MFEGNVLVKKYRGGRQEDYLKKGFALFGDLPVEICIYLTTRFFFFFLNNILYLETFIFFSNIDLLLNN